MRELLKKYQPRPIDEPAKQALIDKGYQEGLIEYDQEVAKLLEPIWQREYPGKEGHVPSIKSMVG